MAAMLGHADKNRELGFSLPVPWLAVRDSFANHKVTTIESLNKPMWGGRWRLYDNNHLAVFRQGPNSKDLVLLKLAGADKLDSLNKLRQEVTGVWIQEAAPVELSGGVSETAHGICNSSKGRIPAYCTPTLLDFNYPDNDHWTWKRFFDPKSVQPGCLGFRIPPRENKHVPLSYWDDMELALANRPDLKRRLALGEPGAVVRGPQVAVGFLENRHVWPAHLPVLKGEPVLLGQDGGLTPATIIGQTIGGMLRINAALPCARGGMRQHYEKSVIPWIKRNCFWLLDKPELIRGCYDPSFPDDESDSDRNPLMEIQAQLGGHWQPGPVDWEPRRELLLSSFGLTVPQEFRPALMIDAVDGDPLVQALSTRWHYPMDHDGIATSDKPKQPNHPWEDLGSAYCYWLYIAVPELRAERTAFGGGNDDRLHEHD
ncbi:MAG: hypothetical protein EXR86_12395 [Gammaproteobacteria bacterium]|nr:hypothetical protein [Gammaproteobacteria bacterium]